MQIFCKHTQWGGDGGGDGTKEHRSVAANLEVSTPVCYACLHNTCTVLKVAVLSRLASQYHFQTGLSCMTGFGLVFLEANIL